MTDLPLSAADRRRVRIDEALSRNWWQLWFDPDGSKRREIVQEVINTPTTTEQLQQIIDELQAMRAESNAERLEREIAATPYSGLARVIPRDPAVRVAWLGVLLMILQILLQEMHEEPPQTVVEVHVVDAQQISGDQGEGP